MSHPEVRGQTPHLPLLHIRTARTAELAGHREPGPCHQPELAAQADLRGNVRSQTHIVMDVEVKERHSEARCLLLSRFLTVLYLLTPHARS